MSPESLQPGVHGFERERVDEVDPAHGEEMRDLIEARVQLRNVIRALERRTDGVSETTRGAVAADVARMAQYLERLGLEFRDNYKTLSDAQRAYEQRAEVLVKQFGEREDAGPPPALPGFVWVEISRLPGIVDFIGEGTAYRQAFEEPLDRASQALRQELATILRQT